VSELLEKGFGLWALGGAMGHWVKKNGPHGPDEPHVRLLNYLLCIAYARDYAYHLTPKDLR